MASHACIDVSVAHERNELEKCVLSKKCCYPDNWMKERMSLVLLKDILHEEEVESLRRSICDSSKFTFGHVAGQKLGASPNRGVRVMCDVESASKSFAWTAHASRASTTVTSSAEPFPPGLMNCIGKLKNYIKRVCPTVDSSDQGFATLAVANSYNSSKHRIAPHTDDQPWYAEPCIFASLTFYDGELNHPDSGSRFFIKHENGDSVRVHLPDASMLVMSARIVHEVRPSIKSLQNPFVTRYNVTLRNLHSDPVLRYLGYANHFRYYGTPTSLIVPDDLSNDQSIRDLKARFQTVRDIKMRDIKIKNDSNSEEKNDSTLQIVKGSTASMRLKRKRECRELLLERYPDPSRKRAMKCVISKSNVVLEALEDVLKIINE